jgi:hypothetical protein
MRPRTAISSSGRVAGCGLTGREATVSKWPGGRQAIGPWGSWRVPPATRLLRPAAARPPVSTLGRGRGPGVWAERTIWTLDPPLRSARGHGHGRGHRWLRALFFSLQTRVLAKLLPQAAPPDRAQDSIFVAASWASAMRARVGWCLRLWSLLLRHSGKRFTGHLRYPRSGLAPGTTRIETHRRMKRR